MESAEGDRADDNAPQKTSDQHLNRACESCRLSKVRCLPTAGSLQCQRCTKAKRTCVFVAPQKRRQRKRTDVRVAELEREVRQMRALLKASRISNSTPEVPGNDEIDDTNSDDQSTSPDPTPEQIASLATVSWISETITHPPTDKPSGSLTPDIVTRGLISMDMANEFLDLYRNELCDYYPGTLIPKDCTVDQLRKSKPVLFLSIMTAASQPKGAELSQRLFQELLHVYADRMFIKGEKSLEYVQALLNTINYYTAPGSQAQIQFYQYSNMAATMALEIGIASKPRSHDQLPLNYDRYSGPLLQVSSTDGLLENCRTILLCYLLTAGLAMRLRRPNILVFNSWMAECMTLLEKSPTLLDKRICAWVRLQRIADETTTAFGFDDTSTSFAITELRMQVVLREFERKMDGWMKATPPEVMNISMRIFYHQNIISMWDFAIDEGKHDAPNFRTKYFTLPRLEQMTEPSETAQPLKSLQINATLKCMGAAQSLLDCLLELPPEKLRVVPNVFYVRATFALVVLLKADFALETNQIGLGELMDNQSRNLDYYMSAFTSRVKEAIGPQKCFVPSHWLKVMTAKVIPWHEQYQQLRNSRRTSPRSAVESHSPESSGSKSVAGNICPSSSFAAFPGQSGPMSSMGSVGASSSSERIASPTSAYVAFPGSVAGTGSDEATSSAGTGGHENMAFANAAANVDQNAYDGSQWGFLANDAAFTTAAPAFQADMSALFEQGDLYFCNESMDLSGSWMQPGTDFNSMDGRYPPPSY